MVRHAGRHAASAGESEDISYEKPDGIAKVMIDRPEVLNAFRPQTLIDVGAAMELAREDPEVGVIVFTGAGEKAFCSGGDQKVRGDTGYMEEGASVGRFHVTDLQIQMRRLNAIKLIKAGVTITLGTDNYAGAAPEFRRTPKPESQEPGLGTILAIEGLVELGMTPAQAIVSATKNGALAL